MRDVCGQWSFVSGMARSQQQLHCGGVGVLKSISEKWGFACDCGAQTTPHAVLRGMCSLWHVFHVVYVGGE